MIRYIFYKEWVKLRWIALTGLTIGLAITGYTGIELAYTVRNNGAVPVWDAILHQNYAFFSIYRFFPIAFGLALGLFQMFPEAQHKRIKLSMHLPGKPLTILFNHILIGSIIIFIISLLNTLFLTFISNTYFSSEITVAFLLTALPWNLSGWSLYLATAGAVIEPQWKIRGPLMAMTFGFIYFHYIYSGLANYTPSFPLLLGGSILLLPTIIYSGARFKKGIQS
ncbi:hypothetical protein FUAX_18670 [Fulvitalea axinellae]|uniref:Uncharacterized protein n=1 Tax=Fulvitalea axinellae TaxID=1182444 RepID=A0AAU9DAS2_9BACT|nr:hypothetical protein FUAX_18670 [Fulvitalea axinellae]